MVMFLFQADSVLNDLSANIPIYFALFHHSMFANINRVILNHWAEEKEFIQKPPFLPTLLNRK